MQNKLNENPRIVVKGHVLITDITDPDQTKVLLDKSNHIHPENMSFAIANALAANTNSQGIGLGAISEMRFGNGGTVVLATGRVTYKTPRVSSYGGLYSPTYSKKINPNISSGVESEYNNISTVHIPGQIYSDIICLCTLELGEPTDQGASSSTDMDGKYVFDEIGLYTDGETGSALTHIIFHPVEKSANRVLQVKYTIRVQIQ